jgi:hypothetical protein
VGTRTRSTRLVAACVAVAFVVPASAQAASINLSIAQPSPGQFQATMTGTSDPCDGSFASDCYGEFLTAYKTTPGSACHVAAADNNLLKFQQLSTAGGPYSGSASFYTSGTLQLCAEVERWTYSSGNYLVASTSAIASWSLSLSPEPKVASVKTRSLAVAHKMQVAIGCSIKCTVQGNMKLLRPGNDLSFGPNPVTVHNVGPYRSAYIFVTIGPGALNRLRRQWSPSALHVFGTATFADGTTQNFEKDVGFRRPPRPHPHGGGGGGCTPGYSPCIPPGSDVDCAGGGGNGPRYVQGPVTVTGSDPYGLDADNDGVGCE